ncbi:PilN domain-containing protein [Thermodesulfatator atlanticus]|uniref:PilN domain-containing protein n=1 Tax=Thermodesulfatator atlanticus TaxID=501497 RepID=UPI0003B45976|nr:PilN domain-containing protein [Thermodesulfatator atlanticus]
MKGLSRQLALFQEWLRPATVGAYFDGEAFYLAEDERSPKRRPARAFLAFSHKLLMFHTFKVPENLSPDALRSAVALEAQRIFSLLYEEKPKDLTSAYFFRNAKELRIIFQEKEFFEKAFERLPEGLIPCGVVPAGIALLSFFYHQQRRLPDGAYFVKTPDTYEGAIVADGRLVDLLPSSPKAAEAFLEEWEGEVFEAKGTPEEVLAQGARHLTGLPRKYLVTFDAFPLKPRPKPSIALLIIWLLPFMIFVSGKTFEYKTNELQRELASLNVELKDLKKSLAEIEAFQKKKESYQKIKEVITTWEKEKIDLVSVLNKLAELIPEHTWVRRLEFRAPDEIRLWAEGDNALEVLKILNTEPLFAEAKFMTTVTKNTRTGKEVFSITLKIKHQNAL